MAPLPKVEKCSKEIEQSQITHQQQIEQIISELRSDFTSQGSSTRQFENIVSNKIDGVAGKVAGVDGSISGIRDYLAESTKLTRSRRARFVRAGTFIMSTQ